MTNTSAPLYIRNPRPGTPLPGTVIDRYKVVSVTPRPQYDTIDVECIHCRRQRKRLRVSEIPRYICKTPGCDPRGDNLALVHSPTKDNPDRMIRPQFVPLAKSPSRQRRGVPLYVLGDAVGPWKVVDPPPARTTQGWTYNVRCEACGASKKLSQARMGDPCGQCSRGGKVHAKFSLKLASKLVESTLRDMRPIMEESFTEMIKLALAMAVKVAKAPAPAQDSQDPAFLAFQESLEGSMSNDEIHEMWKEMNP